MRGPGTAVTFGLCPEVIKKSLIEEHFRARRISKDKDRRMPHQTNQQHNQHRHPRRSRRRIQIVFGMLLAVVTVAVIIGLLYLMNKPPLGVGH